MSLNSNIVLYGPERQIQRILKSSEQSMQDPKNYTVSEGAPVQEIIKGMLGPLCDVNSDAHHKLALNIQELHDGESAKKEMKVETWKLKGGVPDKITTCFCFAGDMADVFGIDTSVIADFDKNAVIEKLVDGPPGFQGLWDLCTVMQAFAPGMYSKPAHAKTALAKTSITDYPSRKEVQVKNINVSLLKLCTNIFFVPLPRVRQRYKYFSWYYLFVPGTKLVLNLPLFEF